MPGLRPADCGNLVALWIASLEAAGETRTQGLARLNAALETATGLSRLGEWAEGERAPDARAFAWMLQDALPAVLGAMPLGPRQRAAWGRTLAAALALPENRHRLRRQQGLPAEAST